MKEELYEAWSNFLATLYVQKGIQEINNRERGFDTYSLIRMVKMEGSEEIRNKTGTYTKKENSK